MALKIGQNEIVIEVATKDNCNLLFHPLGDVTLRGRWDPSNEHLDWDDDSPYRGMPLVPGIFICLDMKARTLRGIDPLELDRNKELLDSVRARAKPLQGDVGPMAEIRRERLNDTEVKTAMWNMYELVESKYCVMVQGEFPKREAILGMPGELMLRMGGNMRCYDPLYSLETPLPPFAVPHELERLGAAPAAAAK